MGWRTEAERSDQNMNKTTDDTQLAEDFGRYFEMVPATNPSLCEQAYRIRYAVYAAELGWEDRASFPAGIETDEFDSDSVSCLLRHRSLGRAVGCVRLVLSAQNATRPFPFENAAASAGTPFVTTSLDSGWRRHAAEISRVAVVAEFRRRRHERNQPHEVPEEEPTLAAERRVFPHIAIGLYLGAAALGMRRGLEQVFAIMEPKLARRLRIYGILFDEVGPPIEHHGLRVPYCLRRENFVKNMAPPIRVLFEAIDNELGVALAKAAAP